MAKKGSKTTASETAEKAKKIEKVDYIGERNDDGKLQGVPSDYDGKANKPLRLDDFISQDIFFDYRAHALGERIDKMVDLKTKLEKRAKRLRQFGDENSRKKALRREKLMESLAAINSELEADGFDLEELDSMDETEELNSTGETEE